MKKNDEELEFAKREFFSALRIFAYFIIFSLIYTLLKSIIPIIP
jgi:hypothetical protein